MTLEIVYTGKMARDVARMKKRGKNMRKLVETLALLAAKAPMPAKYHDHQLSGNLSDFRECRIESDWLLIYQIFNDNLTLVASGTGTHSDLFK